MTRSIIASLLFSLLSFPITSHADPGEQSAQIAATPPVIMVRQLEERVHAPHGKVLIVNVWASWCAPCREEWPLMRALVERYRGKGLELIAIAMDMPEDATALAEFIDANPPNFPVFWWQGSRSALESTLGGAWISGMPTTIVFNPKGEAILTIDGIIEIEAMHTLLDALLIEEEKDTNP